MSEQTIDISGQRFIIQVYPMAKAIWIAVGEHLGEQLRDQGPDSHTSNNGLAQGGRVQSRTLSSDRWGIAFAPGSSLVFPAREFARSNILANRSAGKMPSGAV